MMESLGELFCMVLVCNKIWFESCEEPCSWCVILWNTFLVSLCCLWELLLNILSWCALIILEKYFYQQIHKYTKDKSHQFKWIFSLVLHSIQGGQILKSNFQKYNLLDSIINNPIKYRLTCLHQRKYIVSNYWSTWFFIFLFFTIIAIPHHWG